MKNRNSKEQVTRDIDFIKLIREANERGHNEDIEQYLRDWQEELEFIEENIEGGNYYESIS